MKKKKVINIVTWIVTLITIIFWLPVFTMGVLMIKGYMTQFKDIGVVVVGKAYEPTSTSASTFAFIGGVSDFVILGGLLILTIVLWCIRNKLIKK